MKEKHNYLVPDYYPKFACKAGKCRSACCEGWPISLSMKDYFQLLGVDCSPELRRRLDCALTLADHPTEQEYAQIHPRYDGHCPMHMEDGRCAIHAELGDDALAAVCRLYPRGVRTEGDYECSCANSCEATLELLFQQDAPISFVSLPLTFHLPQNAGRTVFFETFGREQEIRLWFIQKIQNRTLPLPERLFSLGLAMKAMEHALNDRDEPRVDRLLRNEEIIESDPVTETIPDLAFGLHVAEQMLHLLDERSESLREYGEAALCYFGDDAQSLSRYEQAKAHWEAAFPRWEIWFEHMLANHMFFERFPFQDRPESLFDEFIAICAVYALLRFLAVGWMADKDATEPFVDAAAAAFRLIDHTAFDRYAARMLKELGCDTPERLYNLVRL